MEGLGLICMSGWVNSWQWLSQRLKVWIEKRTWSPQSDWCLELCDNYAIICSIIHHYLDVFSVDALPIHYLWLPTVTITTCNTHSPYMHGPIFMAHLATAARRLSSSRRSRNAQSCAAVTHSHCAAACSDCAAVPSAQHHTVHSDYGLCARSTTVLDCSSIATSLMYIRRLSAAIECIPTFTSLILYLTWSHTSSTAYPSRTCVGSLTRPSHMFATTAAVSLDPRVSPNQTR